jgi:hypothetical protein
MKRRLLGMVVEGNVSGLSHAMKITNCLLGCCSLAIIVLMMEAVNTSKTLVNFHQTTPRRIPESNHLHTCNHENLTSQKFEVLSRDLSGVTEEYNENPQSFPWTKFELEAL